jgi:hypothetical protein
MTFDCAVLPKVEWFSETDLPVFSVWAAGATVAAFAVGIINAMAGAAPSAPIAYRTFFISSSFLSLLLRCCAGGGRDGR